MLRMCRSECPPDPLFSKFDLGYIAPPFLIGLSHPVAKAMCMAGLVMEFEACACCVGGDCSACGGGCPC